MTATRLVSASILVALLAWGAPTPAQPQDTLELSGHGLTCIDDAAGWYVARVVRLDHRGRFDLQVVTTVHGRPQRVIDLKSHLSSAQWHQLRSVHEGQRAVVRMPYYVASGEGELGGCRSFFFEGGTSSDLRAFPVGQRFKRRASDDDFHVRLAYLQTYFAARSDPSAKRLAADSRIWGDTGRARCRRRPRPGDESVRRGVGHGWSASQQARVPSPRQRRPAPVVCHRAGARTSAAGVHLRPRGQHPFSSCVVEGRRTVPDGLDEGVPACLRLCRCGAAPGRVPVGQGAT